MSENIKVKDMIVGKCYKQFNIVYGKLIDSSIISYGGSGFNEPQYRLVFEDGNTIIQDWDNIFEELYITPFPTKNVGK